MGLFEQTVDTLPPGRPKYVGPQVTGVDAGHDLNLHTLARDGVILLGRLQEIDADKVRFAPDLPENIAKSDTFATEYRKATDNYIDTLGLDAPTPDLPRYTQAYDAAGAAPILGLDFKAAGLAVVVWATGIGPTSAGYICRSSMQRGTPSTSAASPAVPASTFWDWIGCTNASLGHF